MQYALIEVKEGVRRLVAASELAVLHQPNASVADGVKPPENGPFFIAYGCYMPQPDKSVEQAENDLNAAADHWLGFIANEQCNVIAFHEVENLPPRRLGRQLRIPFAALIQADDAVLEQVRSGGRSAVTAFIRYSADMDALTNVLNRPGIIAFKGLERRRGEVTKTQWRGLADAERAVRVAMDIK